MLVPSDLAVFNNHLAYVRLINAGLVTESSVKNSQVIDLESGKRHGGAIEFAGNRGLGRGFLANLICDSLAMNDWRGIRCGHGNDERRVNRICFAPGSIRSST